MNRRILRCELLVLLSLAGLAQETPKPKKPETPRSELAFEVASIKAFVPGRGRSGFGGGKRIASDSSMLRMRAATPEELIQYAYSLVWPGQLVGLPEGLGAYDIDAKTPFPASEADQKVMLQALLAERFRLVCHHEQKDMKAYGLTTSKNQKLESASEESEAGIRLQLGAERGAMTYAAKGTSMTAFAIWLSGRMDRPVVDQTGLKGTFNFNLRLDSNADPNAPAPPGADRGMLNVQIDESSYIAALKRLGLNLEQRREPVHVVVVDHVEKPSLN